MTGQVGATGWHIAPPPSRHLWPCVRVPRLQPGRRTRLAAARACRRGWTLDRVQAAPSFSRGACASPPLSAPRIRSMPRPGRGPARFPSVSSHTTGGRHGVQTPAAAPYSSAAHAGPKRNGDGRAAAITGPDPAIRSSPAETRNGAGRARSRTALRPTGLTAAAASASTCDGQESATPSRRRPTARPPAYVKAHAVAGRPASMRTATRSAAPSSGRSTT